MWRSSMIRSGWNWEKTARAHRESSRHFKLPYPTDDSTVSRAFRFASWSSIIRIRNSAVFGIFKPISVYICQAIPPLAYYLREYEDLSEVAIGLFTEIL